MRKKKIIFNISKKLIDFIYPKWTLTLNGLEDLHPEKIYLREKIKETL